MKFGEVPLTEAEGAILAHSLKLGTIALKKGRVLSHADVELITASGMSDSSSIASMLRISPACRRVYMTRPRSRGWTLIKYSRP